MHGGEADLGEGDDPGAIVVIEFADLPAAEQWHVSDAYQAILPRARDLDERLHRRVRDDLDTFSGDSKPGDTNGQGTGGIWYVVGPVGNVTKNALATSTTQAGGC